MAIKINTNMASIQAQRPVNRIQDRLRENLAKLSSGLRINQAADDAAGLAISEKMRAQIRGLAQAERNAFDGISMAQTAEGALGETGDILGRMRELALQSANGTLNDDDRAAIDSEYQELSAEINRIADTTEFNGQKLLDGSATGTDIQVGTADAASDTVTIAIDAAYTSSLGSSTTMNETGVADAESARAALGVIDAAMSDVSRTRGNLGSTQNRLTNTINNLGVVRENISAANSRIRDVDVASEAASQAKNLILQQTSLAVMAQANGLPQMAMALLS